MNNKTLFDQYVLAGGPMMLFIIPAVVMGLAHIIQGFINLRRKKLLPRDYATQLWQASRGARPEEMKSLAAQQDHSMSRIVLKVLASMESTPGTDPAVLLREQVAEESDRLMHQNSQLGLIYRIGPLMGLVGTVLGMIRAFLEFSLASVPDIKQLSEGVMLALTATAWGVGMAFPAYLFLFWFQRRIAYFEKFEFIEDGEVCLHAILGRPIGSSVETLREKGLA